MVAGCFAWEGVASSFTFLGTQGDIVEAMELTVQESDWTIRHGEANRMDPLLSVREPGDGRSE